MRRTLKTSSVPQLTLIMSLNRRANVKHYQRVDTSILMQRYLLIGYLIYVQAVLWLTVWLFVYKACQKPRLFIYKHCLSWHLSKQVGKANDFVGQINDCQTSKNHQWYNFILHISKLKGHAYRTLQGPSRLRQRNCAFSTPVVSCQPCHPQCLFLRNSWTVNGPIFILCNFCFHNKHLTSSWL